MTLHDGGERPQRWGDERPQRWQASGRNTPGAWSRDSVGRPKGLDFGLLGALERR